MIYVWGKPLAVRVEDIIYDIKREKPDLFNDINDVGNDLMVTCPSHSGGQERKPSCGIAKFEITRHGKTYESGTTHCYSCGYRADLPQLVADLLGLDNSVKGLNWLVAKYSYGLDGGRADLQLDLSRDKPKVSDTKDEGVLVTHYHKELLKSDRAIKYLRGRKLNDMEVLELFGIGYNRDKDSIVLPLLTRGGKVVGLKERSIRGKTFHNTKGSEKSSVIFGLYQALQVADENTVVWIVESEIDALTLWTWGHVAIAIMGSHMSEVQADELSRTKLRRYATALDNDDYGKKGIQAMNKLLIPKGFRPYKVIWNINKKDINELTYDEFTNRLLLI